MDAFYRAIGHLSVLGESLVRPMAFRQDELRHAEGKDVLDGTGLLVGSARRLPILWKREGIVYPAYPSPAHSFWRAQEFSLFLRRAASFERPILDFGCGDGSFASVLLDKIEIGVDIDPQALKVASGYGIYGRLVQSTATAIPVESGSAMTVISNSVLEHVQDLDAMLRELSRTLKSGGRMIFTVPVDDFAGHLTRYFGAGESARLNAEYYHRNLLAVEEWRRRLAANGLEVDVCDSFQPAWFTWWYRMLRLLGRRGLGRIVPEINEKVWRLGGASLRRMVRRSLVPAEGGANIFVVARKR